MTRNHLCRKTLGFITTQTLIAFLFLAGVLIPSSATAQTREASEGGVGRAAKVTHWISHHKRFLLAAGAVAGASVIQWKGTSYCQRGDVEHCLEGYGARRAFNWVSIGTSAAMLATAEACWKNDGGKFCYALAYGTPASQTAFGVHDFVSYKPEEKEAPH